MKFSRVFADFGSFRHAFKLQDQISSSVVFWIVYGLCLICVWPLRRVSSSVRSTNQIKRSFCVGVLSQAHSQPGGARFNYWWPPLHCWRFVTVPFQADWSPVVWFEIVETKKLLNQTALFVCDDIATDHHWLNRVETNQDGSTVELKTIWVLSLFKLA